MRKRTVVVAITLIGVLVGLLLRPGAFAVQSDEVAGDSELATRVLEGLPDVGVYAVTAGIYVDGETRIASIGAPLDGTYEIGSISKPITAMLYIDAIERGEVTAADRLGTFFDLGDAPASDITLEELSQHRSGLPRLALAPADLVWLAYSVAAAKNPYRADEAELESQLQDAAVSDKDPVYSNFGFGALGIALAEATGVSYPQLVQQRLVEPLGLESLYVPESEDELTDRDVQGRDRQGRAQQPWIAPSLAPAGGIRADAADMMALAAGLLDGSAPGVSSMEPTYDFDDFDRIGAGWFTRQVDGREVTWHNGGTGGFSSIFVIDREAQAAVFVSAATTLRIDSLGFELLEEYTS